MEVHHLVFNPADGSSWVMTFSSSSATAAGFPSTPLCSSKLLFSQPTRCGTMKAKAFSELRECRALLSSGSQGLSIGELPLSALKTRHKRYMRSAKYSEDICKYFSSDSSEQMATFGSHVRACASIGRLSGALHGSNARKGHVRKRPVRKKQENVQELEYQQGKEKIDACPLEHSHGDKFDDDLPNDHDSDCQIHVSSASDSFSTSNYASHLTATMDIYDSIHGEFWMNDPYYQEFEALHSSDSKMELNDATLIKSNVWNDQESLDPSSPMETSGCRHSCLNNAPEAQRFFLEETHKVAQEQSKPTEAGVELEVDPVSPFHDQSHVGEDVVRNVESAERPLDGLTSLQVVGASLEHRPCAGNEWIEKSELEHSVDARDTPVNDLSNMATTVTNVNGNLEVNRVSQEIDKVPDVILDSEKELEGNAIDQSKYLTNESHVAEEVLLKVVDQVAEVLPDSVVEQVSQVAEQVTQLSEQVIQAVEKVTVHGIGIANTNPLSPDEYEEDTDDEFEAYTSLDLPEFKGRKGLSNFTILQDDQGLFSIIYDFYIFMLKQSLFKFLLGMIAAPVLLSMIFTILYLPEFSGLALDENLKAFMQDSDQTGLGLKLSWQTVFQVFMFSVSLSTGLQPELSPFSPYTLVVANLNALFGQLIFVFLSGAVFARLSQPSQPVKCSAVALICPPLSNRRFRRETSHSVLLARYVLVGPQPCELVDVKVDLTYHYNTVTRSGTFFRSSQSLKLVRPEIAFIYHGMLVRHVIDETSPLYQRTQGMLEREDAVFSLSVVGLERSSMQSIFHVQHYCVCDNEVVWDAEFVDMILINKKNRRIVDHSLVSTWKKVVPG